MIVYSAGYTKKSNVNNVVSKSCRLIALNISRHWILRDCSDQSYRTISNLVVRSSNGTDLYNSTLSIVIVAYLAPATRLLRNTLNHSNPISISEIVSVVK